MTFKAMAIATMMAASTVLPATVMAQSGSTLSEKGAEAGQYVSDAAVTTKVKAALLAERNLNGLKIEVETKDGVVHLGGTATSSAQIVQAVDVAMGIKGVKDVRNNIQLGTD